MTTWTECQIVALDGNQHTLALPAAMASGGAGQAPDWLVRRLGLPPDVCAGWTLRPSGLATATASQGTKLPGAAQARPTLYLVRAVMAAAGKTPNDPREDRLHAEWQRLQQLNHDSDHVRVEPVDVLAGSAPERYVVTFFNCRGLVGIDSSQNPVYGTTHQVEFLCDDAFPAEPPRLGWVTPIWHPNIQHTEPKGVCTNKAEWLGGMGLDDLCRQLFEMLQYKNYHAELVWPYPLDQEAARWVREYAEPRGIVDKKRGLFVDDKPFTRPTVSTKITVSSRERRPSDSRIKILPKDSRPPRIKVVTKES